MPSPKDVRQWSSAPRGRAGRLLLALCALLSIALTATACGGSVGDADAGGATRTVTDATGTEVTVPEQPERVITLSELDVDSSLALGVSPVGATAGRGQDGVPQYLPDDAQEIPLVGSVTGPDMEKVVQADPDLILAGQIKDEQVLSKLRAVAPTVVTFGVGDDWKDAFARIADALGCSDAHQQVLADYDRKVAATRDALGDQADAVVSIVRWTPKGPATINQGLFASSVLADIGVQRPAEQQRPAVHSTPLSIENLDQIDADWIFLGTLSAHGDASAALQSAEETPMFGTLGAAQSGHVSSVDGSKWMSLGGPIAASSVLDDVRQAMGTA